MDRKIKLGFTFTPIPKYNGIDINQLNSIVSKIPTKWDASMANLNKQINTTKTTQPNNLVNRVFKGLSNKTSGTYYDANGNLLFKDGQLTDAGKQLFGKNAQRAEWNMRSGNIFQNNSWRADNTTFDFKNMKALDGYQDKYKQMNGRWVFKDSDGKWTYFNSPVIKQTITKSDKTKTQNKPAQNNVVDKNGFVLASSIIKPGTKNTWDLLQGKNINDYIIDGWGRPVTSMEGLKSTYVANYLDKYNGRNPTDGAPIEAVRDQANKDFDIFLKHYFVKNPSINKNTWIPDADFTPKYIHNGKNLALVNSSDGKQPIIQNINGIPYLMDENGNNAIPMIDQSTGNQNFYIQETKNPNKVLYNNKHYNVYVPATGYKNGGILTNNKFENWINGTK